MMDPDHLESLVEENAADIRLLEAFLGVDLRDLYNEGVLMYALGKPNPPDGPGPHAVQRLGWNDANERGYGGEP